MTPVIYVNSAHEKRRVWTTYPSKAGLVAQVVETANAIFSVLEVVELDESKAVTLTSAAVEHQGKESHTLCIEQWHGQ